MAHLAQTGYVILSGDVVHLESNFEHDIVPALNVDKAQSIASMDRVRALIKE